MTEILEHPWLPQPHELQALLAGRQSQFRRPVEDIRLFGEEYDSRWYPHVIPPGRDPVTWSWHEGPPHGPSCYHLAACPWGKPGDRVWTQEAFRIGGTSHTSEGHKVMYRGQAGGDGWWAKTTYEVYKEAIDVSWAYEDVPRTFHSAIEMPRWASRFLLEVEHVQVQRLNQLTEADAFTEGIERQMYLRFSVHYQPQVALPEAAQRAIRAGVAGPEPLVLGGQV
jgi:hypothetical protein